MLPDVPHQLAFQLGLELCDPDLEFLVFGSQGIALVCDGSHLRGVRSINEDLGPPLYS